MSKVKTVSANGQYVLRIAAFHHNPLLIGRPAADEIEGLFNSGDESTRKVAANLRNYLRDSENVLKSLSSQGFLLGLHGHQHFDGVLHIHFPGKYGEPFARSSIALIGAGSMGLRANTAPQPSVSSAQLLTIQTIPWGWRVTIQRITIRAIGRVQPDIRIDLDEPKDLILPRGQLLEPIMAVNESFRAFPAIVPSVPKEGDDKDPWPDDEKPDEFGRYVLWEARDFGAQIHDLDDSEGGPSSDLPEELLADLPIVWLYGIHNWSEGKDVYGNDQMLTLHRLRILEDGPHVALQVGRFAQTRIVNWILPRPILRKNGQAISFRRKWLLERLSGTKENLIEETPYLSWRNEVTVLVTVQRDSHRDLIVRTRSERVAVDRRKAALFVAGGCRPVKSDLPDGSSIRGVHTTLRQAALNEMERETGCILPPHLRDSNFHLVALYLDPVYLTPVWLFWLDMTEAQFEEYKQTGRRGRDEWEGPGCKLVKIAPSESWEVLRNRILRETKASSMSSDPALGLWVWLQSPLRKKAA